MPAALRRLPVIGAALLVFGLPLIAGCGPGPILANPAAPHPTSVVPAATPSRPPDPQPVSLPRDDGPHDRLTEWWYYTGHLETETGRRFDFEYVIFRGERGRFPVSWASHLAITDRRSRDFGYAQRAAIGGVVDTSPADAFRLAIASPDGQGTPWAMSGGGGLDTLNASAGPGETSTGRSMGLDLRLEAAKPAVLHDTDGWIDFGPAGGSYYYSRTAMNATGTLETGGTTRNVTGQVWFDHQWGDFIAVGGGGWDWFAVNLEDGTDLTLSLVRNADGSYPLVYGTLIALDGTARHLTAADFSVEVTDRWTSPRSGAEYPAGWRVVVPSEDLDVTLRPTVEDQELDTRASTGVIYWEGSQIVRGFRNGERIGGEAYVELTGYGPSGTVMPSPTPAPSP
jgi:predicted secreted hydrolase